MARFSNSKGGWFKLWGKQWLNDKKLKEIGDSGELAYLRVLCYANTLLQQGVFKDINENPYNAEFIAKATRITPDNFKLLLDNDLLIQEDGYFMVKNWSKYQNNNVTSKHKNTDKSSGSSVSV